MWYNDDTNTRCDVDKREREGEESKERSISGEKACWAQRADDDDDESARFFPPAVARASSS